MRAHLLPLAAIVFAVPMMAQFGRSSGGSTFQPRFTSYDRNSYSGECKLRVRIDDEADVIMQGDRVTIRPLRGRPGYDVGSECTAPLPTGGIQDFSFRQSDGRGRADVVEQPDNRRGRLVIRVRDSDGGDDKYTLEFRWAGGGGYGLNSGTRNGRNDGDWNQRNNGRWGNNRGNDFPLGNNGRFGDRSNVSQASRLCQNAVRGEIASSYGYSATDFRINDIDDRRNGRDLIEGEAAARRGGSVERFSFACRVDLDTAQVRDVRVRRR